MSVPHTFNCPRCHAPLVSETPLLPTSVLICPSCKLSGTAEAWERALELFAPKENK